ncbi:PURA [Cordylochernes scorpioides]|uniref:PURA n=1 Tax=Cordylochernes scorpioides TaxID=51811 RepID=A0ABY6L8V2_9ARAC|nr:PURA [Cordylochernes scorpioides]
MIYSSIGRPPDLQSWIFPVDLEDHAITIFSAVKYAIYVFFVDHEIRGVAGDPLVILQQTLQRWQRAFPQTVIKEFPGGTANEEKFKVKILEFNTKMGNPREELGESPDSGMRIVDLKDLILKSSAYDEELVKNMLTNIIEERKAKELKKQRSEELDEERKFELEKLRMQTTHNEFLKTTESVASGTDVPQIEFKKLIPNFNPKETDIATFLNLFERQLKFLKVPNTHWVAYLLGVLPGDVAKLIAREPEEQSHDYDHIKKMLLSRFKLSGDSFRQLFYRHQKSSESTWKDYYFELQNFFESWLQDLRIASFDKLKELIIAEQMKKRTSPEMRDHFWEEWFAWVTPSQLASKLDTYDNLRKIKDMSLNNKRNAYEKTKEIARSFSGPRESFSKITEKPRGETRKKDRSSIYCYGCGAQGFIKARCPTCNLTETVPKFNMNSMSFYSSLVESQPVSLIEVFICHHQAAVCADTGATHSVAGEKLYRLLKDNGVKFVPNITGIKLGDGEEKIVDILTATVDIHVKGKKVPTSLMVLTNARGNRTLLGTDFLKAAGIVLDIPMGKWYFSESPRIKFDFIRNPPNIAALLAVSENVSPCHLRKDEGTHLTVHQKGQLNSLLEKFETCFQPGGEAIMSDRESGDEHHPAQRGGQRMPQEEQELATKMLQIQSKRFYLDVKQNRRGRFIKVAEVETAGRKSRLLLAMSTAAEFRDHLTTFSDLYASLGPPNPDNIPEDGKLKSEVMVKDNRRYYLDLKENTRGRFLRVSQTIARGGPRSQIAIPAQGMIEFRDALTDLLEEYNIDDVVQDFKAVVDNDNFVAEITPYLKRFATITHEIQERIQLRQDQHKKYFDKNRRQVYFSPGDRVWITTHPISKSKSKKTGKFMPRREGPYLVLTQRSPTTYTVAATSDPTIPIGNYHVSSLTPYSARDTRQVCPIRRRGRPKTSSNTSGGSPRAVPSTSGGPIGLSGVTGSSSGRLRSQRGSL